LWDFRPWLSLLDYGNHKSESFALAPKKKTAGFVGAIGPGEIRVEEFVGAGLAGFADGCGQGSIGDDSVTVELARASGANVRASPENVRTVSMKVAARGAQEGPKRLG